MLLHSAGRWRHLQISTTYFRPHWFSEVGTMAGETGGGGDREGLSAPGPINFTSLVGPGGDPIYTKMGPFCFFWTVFQQLQ